MFFVVVVVSEQSDQYKQLQSIFKTRKLKTSSWNVRNIDYIFHTEIDKGDSSYDKISILEGETPCNTESYQEQWI